VKFLGIFFLLGIEILQVLKKVVAKPYGYSPSTQHFFFFFFFFFFVVAFLNFQVGLCKINPYHTIHSYPHTYHTKRYKTLITAVIITGSSITAVYKFSYLLSCVEIHAIPIPAPVAEDKIFDAETKLTTELGSEKYLKVI
jgi:hypothetical protein